LRDRVRARRLRRSLLGLLVLRPGPLPLSRSREGFAILPAVAADGEPA